MVVPDTPVHPTSECRRITQILARIGDKWSVMIIVRLGQSPQRFSDLKRSLDGVSQRMLTRTLRNLERDGLVCRTVTPTVPPRVDYSLTVLGLSLEGPLKSLGDWAFAHRADVEAAHAQWDETHAD